MKFDQLILIKIIENYGHQMSHFKAKMHQIRFRLGLRSKPCWGISQHSPRPPGCIYGALYSNGKEWMRTEWKDVGK